MTNYDELGLIRFDPIRRPCPAPATDEWTGFRRAPSVHRDALRRIRRSARRTVRTSQVW